MVVIHDKKIRNRQNTSHWLYNETKIKVREFMITLNYLIESKLEKRKTLRISTRIGDIIKENDDIG